MLISARGCYGAMREGCLILVRHGETEANRAGCFAASDDIELTAEGRRQAEELGVAIQQQFQPTKLFSSSFRRARQTAEIIGRRLGLQSELLPGVQERSFGCLKGASYSQMGKTMRADIKYRAGERWLWSPSDGESLEEVRTRAIRALADVSTLHRDQQVVVVSHGAVMEAVSAHITGDWDTACVPPNCGTMLIFASQLTGSVSIQP